MDPIQYSKLRETAGFVAMLAGVALIVSISYEILAGNRTHFSSEYMTMQFVVCLTFIADFFIEMYANADRLRFFLRNFVFLLLSVPYLNLIDWSGITLPRTWSMFIGLIPLLRTLLAVYVVVRWIIDDGIRRMFTAYAFTLLLFTYIAALVFYDYEIGVNPDLQGFGNALWWAFMSMTTVGAEIFPVTTVGKVLSALLPASGMLMLPLFTVYISDLFRKAKRG